VGSKAQSRRSTPSSRRPRIHCANVMSASLSTLSTAWRHTVRAELSANRIIDGLGERCSVLVRERSARIEDQRLRRRATPLVARFTPFGRIALRRDGALRFLRFNYTTGDAAGQNMTEKATLAACEWIMSNFPGKAKFMLSGNVDTDKKHSQINMLLTRGKRVVVEVVLKRDILKDLMHVDSREMFRTRLSMAGAFLAHSANNGAHAANGLTALFIATGQDVANIAESHAGVAYTQLLENGDYYWSITLTSLIVGTYGGGTGLATQRECLELLGCYGTGKADKFAEICAATVLAGETSLTSAILAGEWVSSHDQLGRNRP